MRFLAGAALAAAAWGRALGAFAQPPPAANAGPMCGDPSKDAGYCADWGRDYRSDLQKFFDRILAASGYDTILRRFFDGKTEVALLDKPLIDGSPAVALAPQTSLNPQKHPVVEVGTAIFDMTHTPDELAFVLAHEVGHIVKRHSERRNEYFRALYAQWRKDHPDMDGYSPEARQYYFAKDVDLPARKRKLAKCVEAEADAVGKDLVRKAGFDPDAAAGAIDHGMDWIWALGGGEDTSDHESSEERAERLRGAEAPTGGSDDGLPDFQCFADPEKGLTSP